MQYALDGEALSMTQGRDQRIEEEARRIARDHDLDPDDGRLGYPAWRIPWILEEAARIVDGEIRSDEKRS